MSSHKKRQKRQAQSKSFAISVAMQPCASSDGDGAEGALDSLVALLERDLDAE